jgi:L-fuconolactonase
MKGRHDPTFLTLSRFATLLACGCAHPRLSGLAWVTRLRPEKTEEYKRLHADSNPSVRDLLAKYHRHNFSIFLQQIAGKWCEFGCYEYTGRNFDGDHGQAGQGTAQHRVQKCEIPCRSRFQARRAGPKWSGFISTREHHRIEIRRYHAKPGRFARALGRLNIKTSMRIDSHQHFWQYNPAHQVWMTDQMSVLRRDYLPDKLKPLLEAVGFDGSVAVQSRQMLEETEWLLQLSDRFDFIKGVVGWVDLRSPEVRTQLARYAAHPKLRGVRHVVHDEPDDQFMLRPDFQRGIGQLREFNLTYDLLLFPKHLPVAVKLVEAFPHQPFVLDHIAKPPIKERQISPWKEDLEALARFENVGCKLSGLVTEARWGRWQPEDFRRYLDIVIAAFGTDRVMVGSDWPVCTLSSDYSSVMRIVIDYVQQFPARARENILGSNCVRFYGINAASSKHNT